MNVGVGWMRGGQGLDTKHGAYIFKLHKLQRFNIKCLKDKDAIYENELKYLNIFKFSQVLIETSNFGPNNRMVLQCSDPYKFKFNNFKI